MNIEYKKILLGVATMGVAVVPQTLPEPEVVTITEEVVVFPCHEDEVLDAMGGCTPLDDLTPFESGRTCDAAFEVAVFLEDPVDGWDTPYVCVPQRQVVLP